MINYNTAVLPSNAQAQINVNKNQAQLNPSSMAKLFQQHILLLQNLNHQAYNFENNINHYFPNNTPMQDRAHRPQAGNQRHFDQGLKLIQKIMIKAKNNEEKLICLRKKSMDNCITLKNMKNILKNKLQANISLEAHELSMSKQYGNVIENIKKLRNTIQMKLQILKVKQFKKAQNIKTNSCKADLKKRLAQTSKSSHALLYQIRNILQNQKNI